MSDLDMLQQPGGFGSANQSHGNSSGFSLSDMQREGSHNGEDASKGWRQRQDNFDNKQEDKFSAKLLHNVRDWGSIWKGKKEEAPTNQPQQPFQQNQQQQQTNPQDALNAMVSKLPLTANIDFKDVGARMLAGDTSALEVALKQIGENVYKESLTAAKALADSASNDAHQRAVDRSSGNYRADMLTQALNDTLEYTKDPAIAPFAMVALTQFKKLGETDQQAIESVGNFMDHLAELVRTSRSAPRQSGQSRGYGNSQPESSELDFAAILSGR